MNEAQEKILQVWRGELGMLHGPDSAIRLVEPNEDALRDLIRRILAASQPGPQPGEKRGGCPCLYTTPCDPDCTCVKPMMSRGCSRCAKYGSLEQRKVRSERLAKLIDTPPPQASTPPASTVEGEAQLFVDSLPITAYHVIVNGIPVPIRDEMAEREHRRKQIECYLAGASRPGRRVTDERLEEIVSTQFNPVKYGAHYTKMEIARAVRDACFKLNEGDQK